MDTIKIEFNNEQMGEIVARVLEKLMLDNGEVREIVRCKECIYRDKCHKRISISEWDKEIECQYATFPKVTFCSHGKRKDEEDGKAN